MKSLDKIHHFRKYIALATSIVVLLIIVGFLVAKFIVADDWIDMSEPAPPIEELLTAVVKDGDIESYNKLSKYYPAAVLPYAFYMANEHNYPKAYHDVYLGLTSVYGSFEKVNEETCRIAMLYLEKGAEHGDFSSLLSLSTEYAVGRYVKQDSALSFHYAYLLFNDSVRAGMYVEGGLNLGRQYRSKGKKF